ncbi:MAG: CHAT domain-containing protein, partial [Rubrivivax sp.]
MARASPGRHGEHQWHNPATGKPLSGMVIGDGVFLTPGDVEQMRCVPELVFINCCHPGKMSTDAANSVVPAVDGTRKLPPFATLAANLGAQFIRMGVRAVVCAGWAVNDDAAANFAQVFYAQLLGGCSFRDAVKAARRSTWVHHRSSNTWGAYQCYGDPSWRLSRNAAGSSGSAADDYVAVTELVADLTNLAESARVESMQGGMAADPLRKRQQRAIDALKQRAPAPVRESWLARAEVAEALGFAYGEALMLPEAIEALEGALVAHSGQCRIRAAEQSANFKVRQAAEEATLLRQQPAPDPQALAAVATRIEATIAELDTLNRRASTPERLYLLGSASKRLAWVSGNRSDRAAALLRMARYYRLALDMKGGDDVYAMANWALALLLLERADPAYARGDWHAELMR